MSYQTQQSNLKTSQLSVRQKHELFRHQKSQIIGDRKYKSTKNPVPSGFKARHDEIRQIKQQKCEMENNLAGMIDTQSLIDRQEKKYCKKHYQEIVSEITNPDFQGSCMRCLRDTFLKLSTTKSRETNGQEFLKLSLQKDIQVMQKNYQTFIKEIKISEDDDIKQDFCSFSSARISNLLTEMDQEYQQTRKEIESQMHHLLMSHFLQKIDEYAESFSQMKEIVGKHSKVGGERSLFQVFLDNIVYPGKIENLKNDIYSCTSPANLKKDLATRVNRVTEIFKSSIQEIFIQKGLASCFLKSDEFQAGYVPKKVGRRPQGNVFGKRLDKEIANLENELESQQVLNPEEEQVAEPDHESVDEKKIIIQAQPSQPAQKRQNADEIEYFTYGEPTQNDQMDDVESPSQFFTSQNSKMIASRPPSECQFETQGSQMSMLPEGMQSSQVLEFQNYQEYSQPAIQNGIPQNQTQIERIQNMSTEQLLEMQRLAISLYDEANGYIAIQSVEESKEELEQRLQILSTGEHIIVVDLQEEKTCTQNQTLLLIFDCQEKIILETIQVVADVSHKHHIQALNTRDSTIFLERKIYAGEKQETEAIVWLRKRQTGILESIYKFSYDRLLRPVLQIFRQNFLFIIIPNGFSKMVDLSTGGVAHDFPMLNVLVNKSNLGHDFKSVILNHERLLVIMTSRRPNVDMRGNIVKKDKNKKKMCGEVQAGSGNVDTQRIILQNSQIYHISITDFLCKLQFQKVPAATSPKFELLKMNIDTRPKALTNFGVISTVRDKVLLYGGDGNNLRQAYQLDFFKKEVCRVNIYLGDLDRFLTNCIFSSADSILSFGHQRLHIFSIPENKFIGARYYDYQQWASQNDDEDEQQQTDGYEQEGLATNQQNAPIFKNTKSNNSRSEKLEIPQQSGNIDDLLF